MLPTIIGLLIVVAVVVIIIRQIIKDRKNGECHCGLSCSSCARCSNCSEETNK